MIMKTILFLGAGIFLISFEVGSAASTKADVDAVSAEGMRVELMRADEKAKAGSRSPSSSSQNVMARKKYPGGADEDDLQVQTALPIPTRTYDGSPVGDETQAE